MNLQSPLSRSIAIRDAETVRLRCLRKFSRSSWGPRRQFSTIPSARQGAIAVSKSKTSFTGSPYDNLLLGLISPWTLITTSLQCRHAQHASLRKTLPIIGPLFFTSNIPMGVISAYALMQRLVFSCILLNGTQVPQMANQFTGSPNGGMTVYYIQPANNQKVTSFPKVQILACSSSKICSKPVSLGIPHDCWRPHDPQQDLRRPQ